MGSNYALGVCQLTEVHDSQVKRRQYPSYMWEVGMCGSQKVPKVRACGLIHLPDLSPMGAAGDKIFIKFLLECQLPIKHL